MSLEAALQENTAALNAVRAVMESNFGKPGVHGGDKPGAGAASVKTETKTAGATKAAAPAAAAAATSDVPDYEKVVNPKVLEVVKKAGRDVAVALLATFKDSEGNPVKNGKGLQPSDYAAVVRACDAAISAAAAPKVAAEEEQLV